MEQNLAMVIYINIFENFGMACVVFALNGMKIKDIIEKIKQVKPILLTMFFVVLFGTVNGFIAYKVNLNNYKFIIYISAFLSILVLNQLCQKELPRYRLKKIFAQLDLLHVLYMFCITFILQYVFQVVAVRAAEPLKLYSEIQFMIFTVVLMVVLSVISYIQPLSLSKIILMAKQRILYRLYLFATLAAVIYVTYGYNMLIKHSQYIVFWIAVVGLFGIFVKDMVLKKDTYENFGKINNKDNIKYLKGLTDEMGHQENKYNDLGEED